MKKCGCSLKQYSLMAGMFASHHAMEAQITYIDVDPDKVVDNFDFTLDIDNNGLDDFEFIKESLFSFNTSLIACYSTILFEGGCIEEGNSFVGYPRDGYKDIVYPLDSGYLINSLANLTGDVWQFMTFKARELSCVSYEPIESWFYPNIGNWIDHTDEDVFTGIKFKGQDFDCFHFGWIRCVISDSLEQFTIKDYAYNSECGLGIYAGMLASGINNSSVFDIKIYSDENYLNFILNQEDINAVASIYNITGSKVNEYILRDSFSSIKLDVIPGIYIIKVVSKNSRYSQKVYIY